MQKLKLPGSLLGPVTGSLSTKRTRMCGTAIHNIALS